MLIRRAFLATLPLIRPGPSVLPRPERGHEVTLLNRGLTGRAERYFYISSIATYRRISHTRARELELIAAWNSLAGQDA